MLNNVIRPVVLPRLLFLKIAFVTWSNWDAAESVIHQVTGILKCFQSTLCITPNLFGYCPGTKCKFLLGALPMCVSIHRILPLHTFLWMPLRWAAGTQGGVQVTVPLPMWRWWGAPWHTSFLGINACDLPEGFRDHPPPPTPTHPECFF